MKNKKVRKTQLMLLAPALVLGLSASAENNKTLDMFNSVSFGAKGTLNVRASESSDYDINSKLQNLDIVACVILTESIKVHFI